jgi:hypothetical protein
MSSVVVSAGGGLEGMLCAMDSAGKTAMLTLAAIGRIQAAANDIRPVDAVLREKRDTCLKIILLLSLHPSHRH